MDGKGGDEGERHLGDVRRPRASSSPPTASASLATAAAAFAPHSPGQKCH